MIIIIHKIYIKVTNKKDLFWFFGYNFKNLAKIVIFKIKNIHIWIFVKTTNDNIIFLELTISTNLYSNWLALKTFRSGRGL